MAKTFRLTYTVTCELSERELFPDGGAPADLDAKKVQELIEREGGWRRIIADWNLDAGGKASGLVEEIASTDGKRW